MCDHRVCISLITPHLYTRSSIFLLLHSVLTDYFVAFKIMTRSVILPLQFRLYGTDFTTFFLWHENNNFSLHQYSEGLLLSEIKTICVCCYYLFLLVMLQVPTHTSEDAA